MRLTNASSPGMQQMIVPSLGKVANSLTWASHTRSILRHWPHHSLVNIRQTSSTGQTKCMIHHSKQTADADAQLQSVKCPDRYSVMVTPSNHCWLRRDTHHHILSLPQLQLCSIQTRILYKSLLAATLSAIV